MSAFSCCMCHKKKKKKSDVNKKEEMGKEMTSLKMISCGQCHLLLG